MPTEPGLTAQTAAAATWRLGSAFIRAGLQIATAVLLARLIPPAGFGLAAQALIIVGAATLVGEIGMAPAIIQRAGLRPAHIRVAWWLSCAWGLALGAVLWAAAPLGAAFFRAEELTAMIRALALVCAASGVGTVSVALLQRRLDYRSLFWVDILSYGVGYAGIGLSLAVLGYGPWALVWASVAQSVLRSGIASVLSPHPVSIHRSDWPVVGSLVSFGTGTTLARLANWVASNGDYAVVGRTLGPSQLGLYSRAYTVMMLPITEFSALLSGVLFSSYSRIQQETSRLRAAHLQALTIASIVVCPALALIGLGAPELLRGAFGPEWSPASTALRILCVGGLFRAVNNLNDAAARARGAVYRQFRRHAVYALMVVSLSVLGSPFGIEGVATGVLLSLGLMCVLTTQLVNDLLRSRWVDFLRAVVPGIVTSAFAAGGAWPALQLGRGAGWPSLAVLAAGCTAGVLAVSVPLYWLRESWLAPLALRLRAHP
jgi:PST family polysaccharide transporter